MHREYDIRTKTGLSMECFDEHEKGLAAPYNEIRRHRPRPRKNVVLLMPRITIIEIQAMLIVKMINEERGGAPLASCVRVSRRLSHEMAPSSSSEKEGDQPPYC